jgi:hypothetical protein
MELNHCIIQIWFNLDLISENLPALHIGGYLALDLLLCLTPDDFTCQNESAMIQLDPMIDS